MKGKHTHSLDQIEDSRLLQRVDRDFTPWQKTKMPSGSKPTAGNLLSYGDPPNDDTLNVKTLEIGDIASLNTVLNNKAAADHTHSEYALTDHTHSAPVPSGKFLRDDGTWATPQGGTAGEVAFSSRIPTASITVLSNQAAYIPSDYEIATGLILELASNSIFEIG